MAQRLKTVKYAFPVLAALANNTATTVTQMTVYLPETTSRTFRSVVAHVTGVDTITATGGTITTKTLELQLGSAGYSSVANANTLTNSGENIALWLSADYTAYFQTNFTSTSHTCDFRITINQSTGTTTGWTNVCVTLDITYEYDDAASTHIKSVMIPLDMPVAAIGTSATTYDTIPALDTYLPEASKTYRNMFIVVQGNHAFNTSTTDRTVTLRAGTATITSGNIEAWASSDYFWRYVWNCTSAWPATNATQTWQPTCTVANMNHSQAYLVVTYEFNPSTTSSVMNSVMLPMSSGTVLGGTTSSDYHRAATELWIEEPTTITTSRVAFYGFWSQAAAISGLNFRVGTGSFVTYTDTALVVCGSNAAMIRNDAAFTLARGRNVLTVDGYRTDTTDFGWGWSGFWLVNYTSGKASGGVGAHNHTVEWGLAQNGTAAAAAAGVITATAPNIPETSYFLSSELGVQFLTMLSTGTSAVWVGLDAERLSAEGGVAWQAIMSAPMNNDPEVGVMVNYGSVPEKMFARWPGDPTVGAMALESARRWRWLEGPTVVWVSIGLIITYHSITFTAADSISGFTGTTDIYLHRSDTSTHAPGELVAVTSRSGDGSFTFTWYDSVEALYVVAKDSSHVGRSQDTNAS